MKYRDIGKIVTGKTPSTKNSQYFQGDIPFITPEDISNGYLIKNTKRYISKEGYKSIFANTLDGISVLIGCIGSDMGNVAIVEGKCASNQQINAITNIKEIYNPYYIYYNLSLKKSYFRQLAGSTTTPILPKSIFEDIDIDVPIKDIQDKVVRCLKSIDDKIQNNNKINSELESMAKTIYDYWFLQFEFPNEEGKPYKSSGGKMVWNEELGRDIPEGWEVYKVKDCTKHINTGLNPRDNFKLGNGNIKYITVKNITTDGTIDFSGCDVIDEAARSVVHKRSQVSKGDILFASIAPLGRCIIVQEEPDNWDINESVFSIRPNTQRVCTEYLYMFFMSDYFVKKAEHSSTGSVFNGIRISTLEEMNILIPNEVIMKNFMLKTQNIFYMKYKNEKENQNLVSLRDFLLPLLMNGQVGFKENINIKDIEVGKEEVLT